MFNAVIRFALRYRLLVLVISMALMVYGSYLATQMPIDVFPDLDRPRVIIITECPGLATEEVETLVTQPIEVALLGASGVQAVRSQSTAGLNVIYVEFDWNTEIRAARQTVQERLSTLGSVLPEGILPQMTPPASIMGQILIAGLYRQPGPSGGELFPVEGHEWMVELPRDGLADAVSVTEPGQLKVWRPVDRHRVDTWKAVTVSDVTWHVPEQKAGAPDEGEETVRHASATMVIDGRMVKVLVWYDNEYGYVHRMAELVAKVGASVVGVA